LLPIKKAMIGRLGAGNSRQQGVITMQVTCIVATKNAEKFLSASLNSIRAQPEVDVEIIVVDGGSTDRTREIASSFQVRMVDQEGAGLACAWNTGIKLASSSLIAFLDSDDLWAPETLAARVEDLRLSGAAVSVGRVRYFLDDDTIVSPGFTRGLLQERGGIAPIPGAMLIHSAVFSDIGLFDPAYALGADTDWLGRLVDAKINTRVFDQIVLHKRVHGKNLTRDIDRVQSELLLALRMKIARGRVNSSGRSAAGQNSSHDT
jgi:glycosyltransferase involved in cell wall biosynthesis